MGFFYVFFLPYDKTGYLLCMNVLIENEIIVKYKNGKSSLKIADELGVSKPTVLKILNKHNLVRKRNRCSSLNIYQEKNIFFVTRKCPKCKKDIKTSSKDKTIACRNHFNKVSKKSLCKLCSLTIQKGAGNPFYGKKHSVESLKKMSQLRTGKGVGEKNSMSNPKWKKKSKTNLIKKWKSGDLEYVRKIMSEKLKETRRLGKIKSNIVSKKEIEIVNFLINLGIDVLHSYRVDSKICDLYIPKYNLIIEYFGDYWHCNPIKYSYDYFNHKKNMSAQQIWDYDKQKVDLIINYGYNLEVVWESDLKHNNKKIIEIITKYDTKIRFAPERS